jgi:DNA repair protein RadC
MLVRLLKKLCEAEIDDNGSASASACRIAEGSGDGLRNPPDREPLMRMLRRLGVLKETGRRDLSAREALSWIEKAAADIGIPVLRLETRLSLHAKGAPGRRAVCGRVPQCRECVLIGECRYATRALAISSLPAAERPRERLTQLGAESCSNIELCAVLVGSGSAGLSALGMAARIFSRVGDLRELGRCSIAELRAVRGLGDAKAARIKAALELGRRLMAESLEAGQGIRTSRDAFSLLHPRLKDAARESFWALLLNGKNQILRIVMISQGSLTNSIVHPREVFHPAIRESAASVILVHNHPSGDPTPSNEDLEITRRLKESGALIGIRVLDHIIIGDNRYTSFADQGIL